MNELGKQLVLKPLDLLVALKVAVNSPRSFLLNELSQELGVAVSLIHGAVRRAEQARLITRATGGIRASHQALAEFVIHGAKYSFPGTLGSLTRGMPTATGGPALQEEFGSAQTLVPVWPDPEGTAHGPGLQPLHPLVPAAARLDPGLYEALSLFDALRVGAARERELATSKLSMIL